MDGIFTDKEVLADGLAAAKASTNLYNNFSNECSHERVRNVMLNILADEHDIQDDVFHIPYPRGRREKNRRGKNEIQTAVAFR